MMTFLSELYKKANILSFDIVLGALLSAMFANRLFFYNASWWYYVVLASAVWVIYALDHLVDAMRNREMTSSLRHLFYYQNFKAIAFCVGIFSFGIAILLLFYADWQLVFFGISVGFVSLLYLGLVFIVKKPSVWIPKEFVVALIYTFGIWGVPMLLYNEFGLESILFPFLFFLLVFFVLILYSYVDLEEDLANQFYGILAVLPKNIVERLLFVILGLEVLSIFFMSYLFSWNEVDATIIVYSLMILMSFVLLINRNSYTITKHYRLLGESIFFIPGIVLSINEMFTFAKNML